MVVRLTLFVGVMVVMAQVGVATDEANNGEVSKYLANKLFCDTVDLLEGDIGLLIGLILVFLGLWSMIQGAKIAAALPLLITGAFITAIPSLILSTLGGLGTLLAESGMTDENNTFSPPTCPALLPNQIVSSPDLMGPFLPSKNIKGTEGLAICRTNPSDPRC